VTASSDTEAEIRRLYFAEHFRVGTIATQLGVHAEMVRRVLGLLSGRPRGAAKPRARLVDPFRAFIVDTLTRYPGLRATRLYDMLVPRGYHGSVRTLREHVVQVRPRPRREAYLTIESLSGEQAQVDWAFIGRVRVPGGERALWLFVMVLSWSRALWGEFVFDTTVHGVRRSLVRACAAFGGTPRQWLFDNPKTIVIERHGEHVRFHPLLTELSGEFCAQLRVCAPRKANQKGKVERAIRYLRERFLAGRAINSIEQGNRELAEFIEAIAHTRPHPTRAERTVGQHLEEERTRLLPLPQVLPQTTQVIPTTASKTASVRFDTNTYSVSSVCAERALTLVADDAVISVLDGANEVARHARSWGKKQLLELAIHREELLEEKRGARAQKGQDRLRTCVPDIDVLFARWLDAGKNAGSLTARTLKLLDLYGAELFAGAVREIIARGTHDPGALALLCEQRRAAANKPVPIDIPLGEHVLDRDVIPHDLETYDAKFKRRH
jgi:transposase